MRIKKTGVSLVVLILTIVIMFILTGILVFSSGGGDTIKNAEHTVKISNQKALEDVVIATLTSKGWFKGKTTETSEFEGYLKEIKDVTITKLANDIWNVSKEDASISVYKTGEIIYGTIDIWDGNTSEAPLLREGNWYIYTAEEFKFFTDFVNNSNSLTTDQETLVTDKGYNPDTYIIDETTTVYLMNNIDLGARVENGVLVEGKKWDVINGFVGAFEGNNNSISGLYIEEDKAALFYGISNVMQNLIMKNGYVKGNKYASGLVMVSTSGAKLINCINEGVTAISVEDQGITAGLLLQAQDTEVINCTNYAKISGIAQVAGVVGMNYTNSVVKDCTNYGQIVSTGAVSGGIVAYNNTGCLVENCTNKGNIIVTILNQVKQASAGGIIGVNLAQVSNCTNFGMVTANSFQVGGIVAELGANANINNCINKGTISGTKIIGGIAGFGTSSGVSNITNCINEGTILGIENVGGISGIGYNVSRCKNIGNVKGALNVGGICGIARTAASIAECQNIGTITGEVSVGGILGSLSSNFSGSIKACFNAGNIKITNVNSGEEGYGYAGGIAGRISTTTDTAVVSNNYNVGNILINVVDATNIGGVLGSSVNTLKTTNNYFLQGIIQVGQTQYGESKTAAQMQNESFVTLLNTGLSTALWEKRIGANNNYPVLKNVK